MSISYLLTGILSFIFRHDGRFLQSSDGRSLCCCAPSRPTGCGESTGCCRACLSILKDVPPTEREAIFLRAADLFVERAAELSDVLIDEAGSTMLKAGYETHHTPMMLRGMAGECRRVTGETYNSDYPGVTSYSIRRPLGIVLAIAPFNFPLLLAMKKIGWAMAAGNTVVLKPSEVTPVVGLKIAEVFSQAGLPDGVLNVIPANAEELGDTLIADPRVKKVAFTGSSRVGKIIAAKAASHLKKFTLELGGKTP